MHSDVADVIVIGGGVSGLAAARSLSRQGLRVRVLEAGLLLGGRVRTLRVPGWNLPVELGAEFVHGQPSTTMSLAETEGLELCELADLHAVRKGGELVGMGDIWGRFAAALAPALDLRPSWSVGEYLDQQKLAPDEAELVRLLVEGFHAAPLNDVSARGIAQDASEHAEEFRQYRVAGGYERLIAKLEHALSSARVEISLGARVRRVEWRPGRVTVTVARGGQEETLSAGCCLTSVSIGVLQATREQGGIDFEPPLSERRPALLQFAMGQATKVVLRLQRLPFGPSFRTPPNTDFFHDPEGAFSSIWLQLRGEQQQVTAWAGGPKASALAALGPDELRARAVHAVARVLTNGDIERIERSVLESHSHDFARDPLLRGAYSYTRPGGLHGARKLALPCAETLFFCGEALDLAYPGTVAGALGSGQHAARQILAARTRL